MARKLFFVLLIVASSTTIGSSLQCYKCTYEGLRADEHCEISSFPGNNSVVNCTSGNSRCIITKMIQMDSSVTQFRRDCARKDEDCTYRCTADEWGVNVCNSCCKEDLCNKGYGPKAEEQSGTSRMAMTRGLSALGGFLLWCLL